MTYDELMESILTAQEQMFKHSIEANSVTLNGRKYGKLIENLPPNMKPTVFGMAVKADYFENNHEEYTVRLRVMEKESPIIDLTLSVPTESQANSICDRWKKKNQKIYAYLMQELL